MRNRFVLLIFCLAAAASCWAQGSDRITSGANPSTVIGPRNLPLHDGAQALLSGDNERGVELTLRGLQMAVGQREEEAALSNLCAGYIKLGRFDEALRYCDILLTRNDKNWRGYNNRAVVHIMMKQWEKADSDLRKGEELNPDARTMKIARSMYMDAVHPVRPEVEIDDRQKRNDEDVDES